MKVKIWRQKAADREEWASVVKESKAVRGPYSQAISKYVSFRIIHNIPVPCLTFVVTGQYIRMMQSTKLFFITKAIHIFGKL
jgi:hypothetical protein